jgi:metal-responsive CopG/Arc/MetJ family transcriptional regulator
MTKRITGISFETNLLKKIDSQRGLIPRSAYISKIIDNYIKKQRRVRFDSSALSLNTSIGVDDNDRG